MKSKKSLHHPNFHQKYVCGCLTLTLFMYDFAELLGIDTMPYTFSYSELKNATNDFNLENKLGEGGFGPVYKVIFCPFKVKVIFYLKSYRCRYWF